MDTAAAPVIFAANHESRVDGPLLAAALPYRIARGHRPPAGARKYWPARRRLCLRLAQTVPISRNISALAAGAMVLHQGRNLIWFPEGTRSRDGRLQQFKFGVDAMALEPISLMSDPDGHVARDIPLLLRSVSPFRHRDRWSACPVA